MMHRFLGAYNQASWGHIGHVSQWHMHKKKHFEMDQKQVKKLMIMAFSGQQKCEICDCSFPDCCQI